MIYCYSWRWRTDQTHMQEVRSVLHQSLTRRSLAYPLPPVVGAVPATGGPGGGGGGGGLSSTVTGAPLILQSATSDTGVGVAGSGAGPAFSNRQMLAAEGLSTAAIERLQTILMVYSLGFYDVMKSVRTQTHLHHQQQMQLQRARHMQKLAAATTGTGDAATAATGTGTGGGVGGAGGAAASNLDEKHSDPATTAATAAAAAAAAVGSPLITFVPATTAVGTVTVPALGAPAAPPTEAHVWKMFIHLLNQCTPTGSDYEMRIAALERQDRTDAKQLSEK